MDFELTEPQSEFFYSKSKYIAAVAGFGSGKTEAAMVRMLSNMMERPGIDQAYLAPTYSLVRDIWYPKISEFLTELGLMYGINKADHIISIQGLGKIFCRTMDNPAMLVGWAVGDAFLDELDVLPTDKALQVFRKVSARLRQKKKDDSTNRMYVTTTPEGYKATYNLFKKDPLTNSHLIQMSTHSNEHNLPEDYIQDLIGQYPEQLIRAYLLGQFVNLTEGSVYPQYDRKLNNTHYVERPRETLHIGMDFNVYKMAAVVHVIRNKKAYAVNELIKVQDTPTMCDLIKDTFKEHPVIVYPDASGKNKSSKGASISDIRILEAAGFKVNAPRTNPLIKDRVNSVNSLLCNSHGVRNYFINEEKCPNLALCFEQQVYDINGVPDKTSDLDHEPDAAGYFIHRLWPLDSIRYAYKSAGHWK